MSDTIYIKMQSVYVIKKEDGAVKIGISQDVQKRVNALSKQGGFEIVNQFHTEPCSNAHEIEREMHMKYKKLRIDGEWFNVSFEKAVKALKVLFDKKASLVPKKSKVPSLEDIDALFSQKARRDIYE